MLIESGTKNSTNWELRQGCNRSGDTVFVLQTERKGSEGQDIRHCEWFKSESEARSWIKSAV